MKNKTIKTMKKGRKLLLAICLPVLAVVLGVSAIVCAVLGAGRNNRLAAGDLADSTVTEIITPYNPSLDLGNTKIDANSKSAVQSLINAVAGSSSNVTYNTLSSNMESWKGVGNLSSTTTKTKVASQFTQTVTLGGITWDIMYVSKADYTANGTTAGEIIVTLWQSYSNSSYMSKYSSTAVNSPDDTYPSNMYGASYIRSTLVGSTYSTNRTSLGGTSVQNSHWKQFTTTSSSTVNGYAEVLATPANMDWQKTEDPKVTMGFAYHYPNDAWGQVSTGGSYATWSSNSSGSLNYYDNATTTYTAWKNDRIWLPSMTETGWGSSSNTNRYGTAGSGIWNASASQRATGGSSNAQYSWLRSGAYSGAGSANAMNSSGTSSRTDYNLTKEYAVRPAIHLNLKKAANAAGLLTQTITYHTNYGTAPANTTYNVGASTALTNPTNIPAHAQFVAWKKDGYTGSGATISNVSGQNTALNLYATFKPKAATVTSGVTNNAKTVTYGATNVSLSATISHPLLTNKDVSITTYWRKLNTSTNITTGGGITVVDSASPSITFAKPTTAQAGTYVLYYKLTATTAGANKGMGSLGETEAARFTLTVNKATCTVATKPTISPSEIYVGQPIAGSQLTGGTVSCASTGDTNVTGSWQITSTGVYTSSGKIYAKFTPEDADITPITGVEIPTNAVQLKLNLTEDVSGIFDKVLTPKPAKSINVDYYTSVSFALDDEKVIFTVKQDGVAGKTVEFPINAHSGFSSYMHLTSDATKAQLTNSSAALKNITTNRDFTIAYVGADTPYTIYYLLDGPTSDFPAATTPAALDALISGGSQYVYKSTVNGATGSQVKYLTNGKPYNAALAGRADIGERFLNEEMTGELKTVNSDGSTVQLIYLQLNKYTVSFAARGAAPSMQTIEYKYGAAITSNENVVVPVKDISTFAGWYFDENFTSEVKSSDVVNGDVQVYAKFNAEPFTLIFDMNIGESKNQINLANVLPVNAAKLAGGRIAWDTSVMFNGFNFRADTNSEGKYLITYDTNNISSRSKSITATKPSAIGYTFLGWFASKTATAPTSVIYKPTKTTNKEITLTARWEPTVYTVTFDLRDGNNTTVTKSIENLSLWGRQDKSQNFMPAGNVLPTDPVRSGYTFTGWYVTAAAAAEAGGAGEGLSIYNTSAQPDSNGNVYFSIANFGEFDAGDDATLKPYGNEVDGYNFSRLTLYAGWKSVDVYIRALNKDNSKGKLTFTNEKGDPIATQADAVHIGDKITITPSAIVPDPTTGYQFKSLTAGNQQPKLKDGVLTFTITGRDVTEGEDGKLYLNVEAVFEQASFTITYYADGGRIADTSFKRTYKASDFVDGQESNIKLPSKLTKRGYEFDGWIFDSTAEDTNPQLAHRKLQTGETSFFGLDLRMVQAVDDEQNLTYRNVTLKACWKAMPSYVYLYNAHYNGEYDKPDDNSSYYLIDGIFTDEDIEISNPSRGDSFVFLGWATTRNGAVVYQAVEGEDTVSYKVNADTDEKGAALNLNNLYAVWRVADLDYVIMSATNNGGTYVNGGDGITITARPSRNYAEGITLTYKWYKVTEGMYNQCFITKDYVDKSGFKWYLDAEGVIKAYEDKDGNFFDEDMNDIESLPDGLTKLTYKEFNSEAVGTACVQKNTTSNLPTLNVKNVADCGIYICVVEVTGGENEGGDTQYGEIEITMKKAVYGGLWFENTVTKYNSKALGGATVQIKGLTETISNGLKTIELPDKSKVVVTYRYFVGDGDLREEITDLSLIKNVGVYHVEASFAFAIGGDRGNYEIPKTLEADLIIEEDEISHLEFVFMHNGVECDSDFSGVYDGNAYSVEVVIKDTFGTSDTLVIDVDDISVEVDVYRIDEYGDELVTEPTTDAGKYIAVIVGLTGSSVDNYVLGELGETSQVYTITKRAYDVAGHIGFADDEVVYDGETHTVAISVEEDFEMPSTVSVAYEVISYVAEAEDFTSSANIAPDKNGGIHAGTYTIKVTFTDSASANYQELESMTATLTIKQASFFGFYNKDGADILRDAGFVNASYAYDTEMHYNPYIKGGLLNDKENFETIEYEYYRVIEENGVRAGRTFLAGGTYEELKDNDYISRAGKYEIVAVIDYKSALYRNNFEEIPEADRTITYVIREMAILSVKVTEWKDGFDKVAKLGAAFDYSWIKAIQVEYESEIVGKSNILTVTNAEDIALAGIRLEKRNDAEQNTFWHVGSFNVIVSFYGTESTAYEFTVKEDVKNFVLKYRVGDDGEYQTVGNDGLEMLTDGMYGFIIEYECTNEEGEKTTLSSVASVSEDGLVLGSNQLTVTEDYYAFGEVSVKIYRVITDDVVWQYSTDGENWSNIEDDYPDYTLPYIGAEYFIRVAFIDGGEEQSCPAKTVRGRPVLNYTADHYLMRVDESGNYRIDAECNITIARHVLEVTWSDGVEGFVYNGLHQAPVVDTDNVFEVDKDRISFKYQLEDEDGNVLREYDVIGAGTYVIKIEIISDDPAYADNYTVYGSETATHTFVIERATVDMSVTYSESNYGENVTYAGNAHGLRLSALKANFNKSSVSGSFAFIKYTEDGKFVEIAGDDEWIKSQLTGTPEQAEIDYAFKPDDDNYKVTTGQLTLSVLGQTYKTGKDSLLIVRSEEAKPYHLVGNQFDTKGIIVYRLYQSYYTEGDRWYGFRGEPVNANLVIGDSPANGYLIDKEVVSGGTITLKAISGTNTGYLNVPVIEKEAESLEITSTGYRTEFYVGETFDFSDMEFRAIFDSETAQDGLKKGTVTCDFDEEEFDTAGTKVITFSCFGATCELTVLVKEKEDLQIVNFKNAEETLVWTGEELAAPALKFRIDGDEYTEYDGITVTCRVMQGQQETVLKNEGTYTVTYTVTVTNPRFNKIFKPIGITVYVTKNPYSATVTLPTELSKVYTGNSMSIPRPVIGDVLDASNGNAIVHDYTVVYTINGEEVSLSSDKWSVKHRGEYVVTITIRIGEYNAILSGNDSYTFEVTQAANTAEISVPSFVVLGKTQFDFKVTAKFGEEFGANIAVEYKHESGNWSTDLPSIAGKWFARVKVAEEEEYGNFAAVTTDAVEFEVRNPEASANVGNGSISDGNGIGEKWELEINRMEAEAVSQVSISKQDVHDGYEVVLKKPGGTVVSGEGEYTVRIKLAEELSGRSDLKVFFKDENGNTVEKSAKVVDGYIEFKTSEFGTFIITSAQPKASVGLLVAIIVLGVVAAGMITACIIVFVKKKKKGAQ